jgi:hypothetical protein
MAGREKATGKGRGEMNWAERGRAAKDASRRRGPRARASRDLDDLRAETRGGRSVRKKGKEKGGTRRGAEPHPQGSPVRVSPFRSGQAQALSRARISILSQSLYYFLSARHARDFYFKYPCTPVPPLPFPPIHPRLALMSPIALHQQHAAVLHGPKDLRIDDRTLWPPQQGQAQVAIVSTGLCGSDRMSTPCRPHQLPFLHPLPSTLLPSRS